MRLFGRMAARLARFSETLDPNGLFNEDEPDLSITQCIVAAMIEFELQPWRAHDVAIFNVWLRWNR
jgi:hypothetical protein